MTDNLATIAGRNGAYVMPPSTLRGLTDYRDKGNPTGDFLKAVLSNDLIDAMRRADIHNRACMYDIVRFCMNELPQDIWGNRDRVENYLERRLEEHHANVH
jgi:hypothetical protein